MKTTTVRRIFEEVQARLDGTGYEQIGTDLWAVYRASLSARLRQGYEAEFWPELVRVEQRQYRPDWDGEENYVAGDEVYMNGPDTYYQALRANLATAPATVSGTTWTTTSAYWAECASSYSAAEWTASTAYAVEDQVTYSGDTYQCHTAHTSGADFDGTKWGLLTAFDRYVDREADGETEIGDVIGVYERNPRISPNALEYPDWYVSANGVQVPSGGTRPWVEYRVVAPEIWGETWDATAAYAVGEQVYYRSTTDPLGYPGDFYTCTATTTAGDSPATDTDKWSRIEIPAVLKPYLVQAIYADALEADGQVDKAAQEMLRAEMLLGQAASVTVNVNRNARRPMVLTR